MALFFDRAWFDHLLTTGGITRADMASSAGVALGDLELMFKDQMEVSVEHVAAWADVLGQDEHEVARRCGISTPVRTPHNDTHRIDTNRIASLEARVLQLEAQVRDLIKPQVASL